MAILEIKTYPAFVLSQNAKPVEQFDDSLRRLLDDMAETMHVAPGVGLAAPQVGVSLQAIVVDISPMEKDAKLIKLVNPVILAVEGKSVFEEGCLSVPGVTAEITRSEKVLVEGYDEYGKPVKIETDTFLARVLQHEIDHLQGVLFIDHLGRLKRDLIKRKLKKSVPKKSKTKETTLI